MSNNQIKYTLPLLGFFAVLSFIIFNACNPPIVNPPSPNPTDTVSTDTSAIDTTQTDTIATDTIPTPQPDDDDPNCCPDGEIEPAFVVLLKFKDPAQKEKVIVSKQSRAQQYGIWHYKELYDEEPLEDKFDFYGMDSLSGKQPDMFEKYIHLEGTSPYIEVGDGYVMFDWKWIGIFPFNFQYYKYIYKEWNVLDISWSELNNIYEKWSPDIKRTIPEIESYVHCHYYALDEYRGEEMPVINISGWRAYEPPGISAYHAQLKYDTYGKDSLLQYIHLADSIMSIYKETIIDAIQHNKLEEIGHKFWIDYNL